MSDSEEINNFSPQPTSKDQKGCSDIAPDHQKDDDIEKNTVPPLQQDPEGIAQDNHLVDDDDVKKREVILHQDPNGCPDIEPNHLKDDDVEKVQVLHQDPKGSPDIADEVDIVETVLILDEHCASQGEKSSLGEVVPEDDDIKKVQANHLKDDDDVEEIEVQPPEDVVDEAIVLEKLCCNSEGEKSKGVVPEEDDDGFRTPTCLESRIPVLTECPGAPRKPIIKPTIKRKASPSSRRRFRVRIDFR